MGEELRKLWRTEDYWSIWFAVLIFLAVAVGAVAGAPRLQRWATDPLLSLSGRTEGLIVLGLALAAVSTVGVAAMKERWKTYLAGFWVVYLLAILSFLVAAQVSVRAWGLGYAIWALIFGLLISNTVGTPQWLLDGARSEMFIKTGLVLLGGEVLFSEILGLGLPGLLVAWVVTPTVIVFMWLYATRVLRLPSKTLAIIIAAATSVCGVSAAIAVAAACRARKSELTLAVGMTMIFTVLMMIVMPVIARLADMSPAVAGGWLGGTIDSTGAVVAAGALLGELAEKVAAVVKMIQNVLIGVVAFVVALFWVTQVDRQPDAPRPGLMEIWYRFPKFILGFVAASVVFSFVLMPALGEVEVAAILETSSSLRGWLFCLAFVAIGLESNFRELAGQLVGGKPIILYAVGQTFNIILTLLMAWIAFGGLLFPPVT
ncbi:MAG: YeiH family protein [Gemmatimonadota bacterium]